MVIGGQKPHQTATTSYDDRGCRKGQILFPTAKDEHQITYHNKEKSQEWLKVNRVQFPLLSTTLGSTNKISQEDGKVKKYCRRAFKSFPVFSQHD